MKNFFYWFSVVICILLVITLNLIFDFRIAVVWEFLICLLVIISPSIILNFVERFFPKKWYGENVKMYNERRFEKKLFKKLKIKKWKDKVPQFLKISNINEAKNNNEQINREYVESFIVETRRGEFMHLLDILFGAIAMLFLPPQFFFRYTLPIFLVWLFYNMLSIIIQRYNRPRLKTLLKKMERDLDKKEDILQEKIV